jgi:capsular exopolysaccharide synthesis family protein
MRDIVKVLVEAGWSVGEETVDAGGSVDECLVTLLRPTSFEAEQFLTLRHHVEQVHKGSGASVVAVSSPGQGDGKTTTAINLAGALAQRPKSRILLVDADFRAPAVAARLGMGDGGSRGLAGAILDPHLTLGDVIRFRMPYSLAVLPAGERTVTPYELLKSPRLGELLDAARRLYEFVILDTPPLVPFPDGRAIARWVDGVLVVIAAGRTPRPLLAEALDTLDAGKVLGLIWNNDDRRDRYHYGYVSGRRDLVRSLGRLA